MSKASAIACLFIVSLVSQVSSFEIGDRVVTVRECEIKEGGVVIKKAFVGEQFSIERIDGHRLLLGGAGSVWADDKDFLGLEDAVEHFSRLIEKNPADWQSLCARGRAREELGQNFAGMNDLDEAVRLHACCETYRRRGGAYANRGMKQRAVADFDEAIRRDPKSAAACRERAMLFHNIGENKKSLSEINKALDIEPANPYCLTCRGLILLENDLPELALADADSTLRLVPTYLYARKLRGSALRSLDRNEEAIVEFATVLRDNPRDFRSLMDRGCIWYETEAYNKAIADLTEAIKLQPHPAAYMSRGMAYTSIKDFPNAEADLNQVLKFDPNNTHALLARGMLWLSWQNTKKAIQDFDAAIKLNPDDYQCYVARVMAFNQAERFEDALEDCEQLIRLKPDSAKSHFFRGMEHRLLKNWSEANADLNHALKLDEKDAQILAEAAFIRAACPVEEFRNPNAAVKLATKAVNQSQEKSRFAYRALAAAHAAQGDFANAMVAQKQALKLFDPDETPEEQERLALYEARKPFRFK